MNPLRYCLLLLCVLLCREAIFSQAPSQKLFTHPAFRLGSACRTAVHSEGFLRAGYCNQGSFVSVYIEKGDTNGFISGPGSFSKYYNIHSGDSVCSQPVPVSACEGIAAIETDIPGASAAWYAACGVISKGIFFLTLDAAGIPLVSKFFPFPCTPAAVSRPVILESKTHPMHYFISASCDSVLFVMKVDANGDTLWSKRFHSGTMQPGAMIEDPYNGYLLVAGETIPALSYSLGPQAFILSLNKQTGAVEQYVTYGDQLCQSFSSIALSASVPGGPGFILGGNCDPYNTLGSAWLVKLNASLDVVWSTILEPKAGFGGGPVTGVAEHYNSVNDEYAFFGTCTQTLHGMLLLKLGAGGQPFAGNNHFTYNAGSYWSSALAATIASTVNAKGIELHGLNDEVNISAYYFVQADLNGESACTQTLGTVFAHEAGATATVSPWIATGQGLTACTAFNISANPHTFGHSVCGTVTENSEVPGATEKISVYPQPASGLLTVVSETGRIRSLRLNDAAGRLLQDKIVLNAQAAELDLSRLQAGLYFIEIFFETHQVTRRSSKTDSSSWHLFGVVSRKAIP